VPLRKGNHRENGVTTESTHNSASSSGPGRTRPEIVAPMNSTPSSSVDMSDEISVLIRTLSETDQRLDDLTAGQVDAVLGGDGRPFLLHHAQDELRDADAAKQAAILNALPAHIVVLDAQGFILSVNDAWRSLDCGNALMDPKHTIGLNYLAACDNLRGDDAVDACTAATGIRAVLTGALPRYSFEYSCGSPARRMWFLLSVTPLNAGHPSGAIVMHVNITEQKRGEQRSLRFGTAMDAIVDAIYLVDRSTMRFVHVNDAACRMQGSTREKLLATEPAVILGVSRAELERTYDALIRNRIEAAPVEMLRARPDGSHMWVEVRSQAQHSGHGWTIVTMVRDVTERKVAENRIAYLNRVYAMLSGINTLIVREHERDELFKKVCQIAVENGGFRLSWMAVVDPTSAKIIPVGLAGADEKLLATVRDILSDADGVPTPMTARAIREKRVVISNDSQNDPEVAFRAQHAAFGVRSMAIFPLLVADQVVGVLSLYANECQFFREEELKLLTELTNDVAFAIDHIEKKERLDYLAYYDELTGLANRTLFLERVAQFLRGAAGGGHKLALLLIDLQRFRNINDSLGRSVGDALLRQVAEWLTGHAGGTNLLARVGVDIFAVVLPQIALDNDLARFLDKMMKGFLDHPFLLNGAVFRIAAKVGIALCPEDGSDADILFRHAEAALKKAKAGSDRYLFYTQKMTEAVAGKLTLENQLHQALDKDQFVLYYQPKVSLSSGLVTGVEALIRWNSPQLGLVPPAQFIPLLEETGLIHEVGRWALRRAIDDYLRWRALGLNAVRIAVNVSALQLHDRNFVHEVEQAIAIAPLAAAGLELEITESLIMGDIKQNIDCLRAIRAMGVIIAIDDFGTGFSSLSYLARLPVHTLKIDRSFVADMTAEPEGLVLVSAIIKLAHSLKLNVVAEGVETEEQSRLLRSMSCDEMQGYLLSKPVSSEVLETRYLAPALRTTSLLYPAKSLERLA
jgi:diguanylate cyclase (GGDEF)-like protein/PAS domain S-box-containing protein